MKKLAKKLKLAKETLQSLERTDLGNVAAGYPTQTIFVTEDYGSCPCPFEVSPSDAYGNC